MSSSEKPSAAFALSLIAGILILINGAVLGTVASFLPMIMTSRHEARQMPLAVSILNVLMVAGIIIGIITIVSAVMLYRDPSQKTAWGVIIIVLSIISIFIGGGFIIGLILGIIGGALALSWKQKTT